MSNMRASTSKTILSPLSGTVRHTRHARIPLRAITHPPRCSPATTAPIAHIASRRSFFSLTDISKLASFATQSDAEEEKSIDSDGEQQTFHARKILPYTQEQLYSIVSDVPSYASFIPFCTASTVLAPPTSSSSSKSLRDRTIWNEWTPTDEPFDVDAELKVGFGGLEERYISRVAGRPFESVTATASEQTPLFKSLTTSWSFSPASAFSPHPSSSPAPPSNDLDSTPTKQSPRQPNDLRENDTRSGPTLLTIDLAFSFANPLHRIASQAVLPKVAEKMVDAFEKRCLERWGKGDQ